MAVYTALADGHLHLHPCVPRPACSVPAPWNRPCLCFCTPEADVPACHCQDHDRRAASGKAEYIKDCLFLLGDHRLLAARSAAPYTHTELQAVLPSLLFSVPPAPASRPCACCCKSCSCQRQLRTGTALKTRRGKPATLENPGSLMQMVGKAYRGCALQAQILLRPISCSMSARLCASVPAGHEDETQQLCGSASCMQACLLTHGAQVCLLSHRLQCDM